MKRAPGNFRICRLRTQQTPKFNTDAMATPSNESPGAQSPRGTLLRALSLRSFRQFLLQLKPVILQFGYITFNRNEFFNIAIDIKNRCNR